MTSSRDPAHDIATGPVWIDICLGMRLTERFVAAFWASPVAGVWASVRTSLLVGVPSDAENRVGLEEIPGVHVQLPRSAVRSMDDYAGYHTGNGLGSLDVGGGCSRWGE